MQTYLDTQDLPSLLEQAIREGEVRIQRADGQTFVLKPESTPHSPLDVSGIDLNVSTQEILDSIRESRERH